MSVSLADLQIGVAMSYRQYSGKTHRQIVSEKLMYYWDYFAIPYRDQIMRYFEVLEIKNNLHVKRGQLLSKKAIATYRRIPFFEIEDREEAADYIDSLSKVELDHLIHDINEAFESRAFKLAKSAFYDLDYTVRREKKKLCKSQSKNTLGEA